jgi:hypothetical protein
MKRMILALLFLALLYGQALAAIAVEDAQGTSTNSLDVLTVSITPGTNADRFLLIKVIGKGGTPIACTVNGSSVCGSAFAFYDNGSASTIRFYKVVGADVPSGGPYDVVVTLLVGDHWSLFVTAYSGVDGTTPVGTAVQATGATGGATQDVSSATGEIVEDVIMQNYSAGGGSITATGTQRATTQTLSGGSYAMGGQTKAGAAPNVTMNWTCTECASSWYSQAVAIKPASGGGAAPVRHRVIQQ